METGARPRHPAISQAAVQERDLPHYKMSWLSLLYKIFSNNFYSGILLPHTYRRFQIPSDQGHFVGSESEFLWFVTDPDTAPPQDIFNETTNESGKLLDTSGKY
jgi:hypothetical protein